MIRIQCTSCKKALDADEKTLSDRQASVVRCPSCGVTLLVDKRNTTAVGPDVRLAADEYKPLFPRPATDELQATAPATALVGWIADLYDGAESHLRVNESIRQRGISLSTLASGAREALDGLRVKVPPHSSDAIVRAVTAAPQERSLDRQLAGLDSYLQASRKIAELAAGIWRNVIGRHRYAPILEWQTEARAAVAEAYAAVAKRTEDCAPHITRLQDLQAGYERLVKQYRSTASAYEAAVASAKSRISSLESERDAVQTRLNALEDVGQKNAMNALPGGGCATLIAAIVISSITAATGSADAGWVMFLIACGVGLFLTWRVGYARNSTERLQVETKLSSIRSDLNAANHELRAAETTLDVHKATTPDIAPAATAWSLLTAQDFDPGAAQPAPPPPESEPVADRPASPAHAPVTVLSPATASMGVGLMAGATTPRPVGFIPAQGTAGAAAVVGMIATAPSMDEDSPAPAAIDVPPVRSNKRLIATATAASLVILVASYLIWSSTFSYGARMNKALSAGQIFAPAGASVYDLYKSEHAKDPRSQTLAEIAPKIRAALVPHADDAFARWYKDSDNTVNWEELKRTCEFLALLDPDTKLHRMRQLYAIAQQSIDSRDYARALSSYADALKLDPTWVLALNGTGKVYMIESSPAFNEKLGVAYYERAAAADPQFTWAAKNLGDYAIRKRNYAMAERYLQQALASSPQRPSILRALGLVCRKTGRRREALDYYQQSLVLEKDPEKIDTAMKAIAAIRNGAG